MEGAWRKVRRALGQRLCAKAPAVGGSERRRLSGAGSCRRRDAAVTVTAASAGDSRTSTPAGALRRSKSSARSASSSSKHKEAFDSLNLGSSKTAQISSYPEYKAVPQSSSLHGFDILIHLKAPTASSDNLVNENSEIIKPSSY
ncbi:hypothetical protein PR202_gb15069 [Eleusine coracana subsp. coracana]|uniref:Uncharacterized protein n=1 Tax=Eleusine coracana subsp. coracana TaxID=191504 RepID=A0AAV5EWW3_ELECO|nr:hypothetical protein PR202_gb15069 [Eleusine coracana subsp. coracana]